MPVWVWSSRIDWRNGWWVPRRPSRRLCWRTCRRSSWRRRWGSGMSMIRRTDIFGSFLFLTAAATLQHGIFNTSAGESIGRGLAVAIAYLLTVTTMRRARARGVGRQAFSMRARSLLSAGVLLIATKLGLDLSKTGPAGIRALLGVVAIIALLFAAYEITRKTAQNR